MQDYLDYFVLRQFPTGELKFMSFGPVVKSFALQRIKFAAPVQITPFAEQLSIGDPKSMGETTSSIGWFVTGEISNNPNERNRFGGCSSVAFSRESNVEMAVTAVNTDAGNCQTLLFGTTVDFSRVPNVEEIVQFEIVTLTFEQDATSGSVRLFGNALFDTVSSNRKVFVAPLGRGVFEEYLLANGSVAAKLLAAEAAYLSTFAFVEHNAVRGTHIQFRRTVAEKAVTASYLVGVFGGSDGVDPEPPSTMQSSTMQSSTMQSSTMQSSTSVVGVRPSATRAKSTSQTTSTDRDSFEQSTIDGSRTRTTAGVPSDSEIDSFVSDNPMAIAQGEAGDDLSIVAIVLIVLGSLACVLVVAIVVVVVLKKRAVGKANNGEQNFSSARDSSHQGSAIYGSTSFSDLQ